MNKSIGMIELRSIAIGIKAVDEMLKSADIELIMATPVCPGKYIIIITGKVGSVKNSVEVGIGVAGDLIIDSHIINSIHEKVIPALLSKIEINEVKAIGIVETKSALTSIKAGDIALKASNVELLQIRIARELGGKGFVVFSGEFSSVKTALNSCLNELEEKEIIESSFIPSPHMDLISKCFNRHI